MIKQWKWNNLEKQAGTCSVNKINVNKPVWVVFKDFQRRYNLESHKHTHCEWNNLDKQAGTCSVNKPVWVVMET